MRKTTLAIASLVLAIGLVSCDPASEVQTQETGKSMRVALADFVPHFNFSFPDITQHPCPDFHGYGHGESFVMHNPEELSAIHTLFVRLEENGDVSQVTSMWRMHGAHSQMWVTDVPASTEPEFRAINYYLSGIMERPMGANVTGPEAFDNRYAKELLAFGRALVAKCGPDTEIADPGE